MLWGVAPQIKCLAHSFRLKEMGTNQDSKLFSLLNERFTLKRRIEQQTPHRLHVIKDADSSASNRETSN
jgi:hypothetical protein